MWTSLFWKEAAERAAKSAAQAAVALIGVDALIPAWSIDWLSIGGAALTMAVLSVLTSIVSNPVGDRGTPSLVKVDF